MTTETNATGADVQAEATQQGARRKRLIFYHPNSKGSGTAVQFELRLNREGETRYDCFFMEMAKQKSAGGPSAGGGRRDAATFDWANKITVKLDFMDVCQLLTVLEGKRDAVGKNGSGMYHEAGGSNTVISFSKSTEHPGAFWLGVSKKKKDEKEALKTQILLMEPEAVGLRCVFQAMVPVLVFGING